MKTIRLTKKFEKAYSKRIGNNPKLRSSYMDRVALFQLGERGYPLNDHELAGKLVGKKSFSITPDIRVIYEETALEITFLDIGTHNQVYGK